MSEFEQKVLDMLKKIDEKFDKVISGGTKSAAAPAPAAAATQPARTSTPAPATVKPSAVVDRQEEAQAQVVKPTVEGRRICPECKATDFKAEEDKSNVLHQMGGMKIYAKKYICKKCGHVM